MTVVECQPTMKVLLDRTVAGFTVEVGHIPLTGEWILEGRTENYRARVPILPEQRLTAYLHPCVFLPHPDRFFRELKEGEVADESPVEEGPTGLFEASIDPLDYCAGCSRSLLAHESGTYCDDCNAQQQTA